METWRSKPGSLEGTASLAVSREGLLNDGGYTLLHLSRHQKGIGLSETELRARLNHLQELHILPERRVQPGLNSERDAEIVTA
jgi:hypothetical protein